HHHRQCRVCQSILLRRAQRLSAALLQVLFSKRSCHSHRRYEGTAAEEAFRELPGFLLSSRPSRRIARLQELGPERAATLEDLARESPESHPTRDGAIA